MTGQPVEVDIPHKLGLAGARERVAKGFAGIADLIPGGHVTEHRWEGDSLTFTIEGLGQRVGVHLDVAEANVHATFELPQFLSLFHDRIRAKLEKEGPKLLE